MKNAAELNEALLGEALLDAAHRELGSADEAPDTDDLQAYLAGELPEERAAQVRAWVVAAKDTRERTRELAPFAEARTPAKDAPVDPALAASWQKLQQRLADAGTPVERLASPAAPLPFASPAPAPVATSSSRWWQGLAALLALTSSLLALRVMQPEQAPAPQNLARLELTMNVRGRQLVRFPIAPNEPFLMEISGLELSDCGTFEVELVNLEDKVLLSRPDLRLTDHVLRFVVSTQPGEYWLTVSACGTVLDRQRVDLVAKKA